MLKEERKKAAGPLKTMSWITYPVDLDRCALVIPAQNVKPRADIRVRAMSGNALHADAAGIE